MGNVGNNPGGMTGCCSASGCSATQYEERYGPRPQRMQVASLSNLQKDRINEWSEPGALEDANLCGVDCARMYNANADGNGFAAPLDASVYRVADTPTGALLMSTEHGGGDGSMWLGSEDDVDPFNPVASKAIPKPAASIKSDGPPQSANAK
mmetsp:Transcript_7624/g.14201  ORF Transcript_7624/g.14201 Transcript_7624/m.14201 type:complete len:152 (-) Transcript_7624:113-568(-)